MEMLSQYSAIVREKTQQAVGILQEMGIDLWLTFVRETPQVKDPMVDLLVGSELTWVSALIISRDGKRFAIAGRFDVANLERLQAYDRVIGYDQSFQEPLVSTIRALRPSRIAVNYSESDPAADGLTYGMFRLLSRALAATPYASRLISAEPIIGALKGRKTPTEVALVKAAIGCTQEVIGDLSKMIAPGVSDMEIAGLLHQYLDDEGYSPAWARNYCPVVTVGPDSVYGHGMPVGLKAEAGNLVHIDFGISRYGYVSDLQRTWYLRRSNETGIPDDVKRAWDAVTRALEAGRAILKPGAKGWEVDAAARSALVEAGYPEFMHAFGHHIGRTAHDGATILGPKWERYGTAIDGVVEENNIFAIELGAKVAGRGYVSREENVIITAHGAEYLSQPQEEVWCVG